MARKVAVPQSKDVERGPIVSAPSIKRWTTTDYYAGIDVSLELSSVCVVDSLGKIVRETKTASEPEALLQHFTDLGIWDCRSSAWALRRGPCRSGCARVGEFRRFSNPRQFMAPLGLVPKERSTGAGVSRGSITKTGNTRARRMLVEGAWTYRLPARVSREILKRTEGLPEAVRQSPGRRWCGCGYASDIGACRPAVTPQTSSLVNLLPSSGRLRRQFLPSGQSQSDEEASTRRRKFHHAANGRTWRPVRVTLVVILQA